MVLYRIEMNTTFDVGCKSEETAVQLYKKSICIWSQHSLCKIPSLALGVKAIIIVIYGGLGWARSSIALHHLSLSLGHDLQVHPGLFPVAFPVAFPLPGLPPVRPHLSFDHLATIFRLSLFSPQRLCVIQ
jgi:hypothetical protein